MTSRREANRLEVEVTITAWMNKHAGRFFRIPDIASAVNLAVPAVNNALRAMHESGAIEKETRRKRINSKKYPVYQMKLFTPPTSSLFDHPGDAPSWMCPIPPSLTEDQIKGIRTVLGFTGDMRAKKFLQGK
jgi:hypothetical protein